MTVPTSRISKYPSQCARINLRLREQIFMSCAWLAWRRKDLRATRRSMSVRLSPCRVSFMNPEWGMMTHPMMRLTYLIVLMFILKRTSWTPKITRMVYVKVVLGKVTRKRNEKLRRPAVNMSEQPYMPAWLRWTPYVLCSPGNRYLRLLPV